MKYVTSTRCPPTSISGGGKLLTGGELISPASLKGQEEVLPTAKLEQWPYNGEGAKAVTDFDGCCHWVPPACMMGEFDTMPDVACLHSVTLEDSEKDIRILIINILIGGRIYHFFCTRSQSGDLTSLELAAALAAGFD